MTVTEALHEIPAALEAARVALDAGQIGQAICHAAAAHKWCGWARGSLPMSAWPALDLIAQVANEVTHQVCQVAEGRCAVRVRATKGVMFS